MYYKTFAPFPYAFQKRKLEKKYFKNEQTYNLTFKSQYVCIQTMKQVVAPRLNKTHCDVCGLSLKGHKAFVVDNAWYCEMDFKRKWAPRCEECSEFILGVSKTAFFYDKKPLFYILRNM